MLKVSSSAKKNVLKTLAQKVRNSDKLSSVHFKRRHLAKILYIQAHLWLGWLVRFLNLERRELILSIKLHASKVQKVDYVIRSIV